ncbi:hypothetical protein LCM00_02520 [Bacillus infantis]|uniref:hypothetical protein n=1 Tax=Bacillus infantis TaxID=324767 RepID=UPI001CD34CC8|nr:hypothetical protein [Bacillus infantis]MCA1038373.1 hypothetical protein [Bacillus infantis]
MNIGAGIILLFIAAGLLITGFSIIKQTNKAAAVLLAGGFIILGICVLLLSGVFDPYSNHIH